MENVHPFFHSNYVFCHNGTVNEELEYDKKFIPKGETDSERFFYYLLSGLNGRLDANILKERIKNIKDFSGMNAIISNGHTSYVINWYAKKPKYYEFKLHHGHF